MRNIKILIGFILPVFLFIGCIVEDYGFDPTVMPQETIEGANTFGCLIDGWIYTSGRFKKDWGKKDHESSSHLFLYDSKEHTMKVSVLVDMNKSLNFTILSPEENKEISYVEVRFGYEEMEEGKVFITRFDKTKQIISGRFEGGRITKGRFDVHYVVKE